MDVNSKITAYQKNIRERDKKIIARYDALIAEGYMKTIALRTIADEYGFTVSHLSRTFKSVIGIGLLEYIQKLRVDKAKELLEEGASVNDAAVGSGYLDAKALTRAFKKYEGTTPGSYRDSKKQ
jgi:AraC-like DNA-binding protein